MGLRCQKRTLFTFSLPPPTLGYYTNYGRHHVGYAGEMGAERKAPIRSLLCEHIAIPVILVFFFLIILKFKFSPYVPLVMFIFKIVLNISVDLEDMSPAMLTKLQPPSQPPHTPTQSSTPTTQPQTPPPY